MARAVNLNLVVISASIGTGETTVEHGLGRIPLDGFIVDRLVATKIYRGPTAWDGTNVYLRADVTGTVTLVLF